jgi:plasmid stabilization system protein ParE
MSYRVKIVPRAQRDLADLYRWTGARQSDAARNWYRGLRDAIRSLRTSPQRYPSTPENKSLRHLLYGHKPHVYRVIYRVVEGRKEVGALHIRHGARDDFNGEGYGSREVL